MIPLGPVVARSRTAASRASVWAYLTDPDLRAQWWQELEIEPGLGGAVRSVQESRDEEASASGTDVAQTRELAGAVDVWVSGHALGFTWKYLGEERGTAVLVTLRSQGHHTGVTVTETGFDALPEGAARADVAGRGWSRFVDALAEASLVEVVAVAAPVSVAAVSGAGDAAIADTDLDLDTDTDTDTGTELATDTGASELELAPVEVEGEVDPEAAADSEATPIEVDAEPGVGDRLELVTGPIDLPADGLVPLILPEPHEIPLVLPEPPGNIMTGAAANNSGNDDDADNDDGESDFDSLLRGL